jgi:hypothetical protein
MLRGFERGQCRLNSIVRRHEMDARFDAVNDKFDARFDAVDARFDAVNARLDATDRRIEGIDRDIQLVFSKVFGWGGSVS